MKRSAVAFLVAFPLVAGGTTSAQEEPPPPKKIVDVTPVYPESAKRDCVGGMVLLAYTIDREGKVSRVNVLRGIPELDPAAIDAVRQWVYEPRLVDGAPVTVDATGTVNFRPGPCVKVRVLPDSIAEGLGLDAKVDTRSLLRVKEWMSSDAAESAAPPEGAIPEYPDIAKQARVQGLVLLECMVAPSGAVVDVKVLQGVPLLESAAMEALKQAKFATAPSPRRILVAADFRILM